MWDPQQSVPDTEVTAVPVTGDTEARPVGLAALGAQAGNAAVARLLAGGGSGAGLPPAVRAEAESRFGASFDDVRVHTGDEAEQAAQALSARAFTVGTNVYFGRGQYAPDTGSGREVLAHELTHVVQNREGAGASATGGLEVSDPASESEREAEQVARAYIGGGPVEVSGAANAVVHRQPDPVLAARGDGAESPADGPTVIGVVPSGPLVRHSTTGVIFTADAEYVRAQLEDYVDKHGVDSLARFESDDGFYTSGADTGLPEGVMLPTQGQAPLDLQELVRVIGTVRDQIAALRIDFNLFRDYFQGRANEVLDGELDSSERRIRHQLELLGIKVDPKTVWGFTVWTSFSGADNEEATRLAASVRPLMAMRPAVQAAKAELDTLIESGMKGTPDSEAVAAAQARLSVLQRDYDLARHQVETAHPVTQAFNLDAHRPETALNLDRLSSDKPDERATVLGQELTTELSNIDKVRAAAVADPEFVWKVEPIVGMTRWDPSVMSNPILSHPGAQASVVVETSATVKVDQELIAIASGVVLVSLGVLGSVPTAGMSLATATAITGAEVAGAGLQAALFFEAAQNRDLALAVAGTDYERARLLSHDAPDLFWLALELVGSVAAAAGGIKGVYQLFQKIVALRQEALIAKSMELAVTAAEIEPVPLIHPYNEPVPLVHPYNEPFPLTRPHQNIMPKSASVETQSMPVTVGTQSMPTTRSLGKILDELEKTGNNPATPGAGEKLRAQVEQGPAEPYLIPGYTYQLSPAEQALRQRVAVDYEQLSAGVNQPKGVKSLHTGRNESHRVTFDNATFGIYKPDAGLDPTTRPFIPVEGKRAREMAFSRGNEMLQFDVAPTATEINGPQGPGSLQEWIDFARKPGKDDIYKYPVQQREQLAVLDYIYAHTDRHRGNIARGMRDELGGYDNADILPPSTVRFPIVSPYVKEFLNVPLTPETMAKVKAIDANEHFNMVVATGVDADAAAGAYYRLWEVQAKGMITGEASPRKILRDNAELSEWMEKLQARANRKKDPQ